MLSARSLSLLLVALTSAPVFALMVKPADEATQHTYDAALLQRASMIQDSQKLQQERVRQLQARQIELDNLRKSAPPAAIPQVAFSNNSTDVEDPQTTFVSKIVLCVAGVLAMFALAFLIIRSKSIYAEALRSRAIIRRSHSQAGSIGDINAMLDRRVSGRATGPGQAE